jgi:putative transposase
MRRWEVPGHARYLTFSCYRRLPLLSNDQIKKVLIHRTATVKSELGFKLCAWVIMPEHLHLLILPDHSRADVQKIMHAIKRPVAEFVLKRWKQLNAAILEAVTDRQGNGHFWQAGGGYDRNIVSNHELIEKINYTHNNPVRRGFVSSPLEWWWSSARWYEGDRSGPLDIDPI